ncbi:hypothetical protein FXO38_32695 [Capsicum annuum]|nr:hypothetical protein FXO38_32695 [Capsicum annuum]
MLRLITGRPWPSGFGSGITVEQVTSSNLTTIVTDSSASSICSVNTKQQADIVAFHLQSVDTHSFPRIPRRLVNLSLIIEDCFLKVNWDPLMRIDLFPTKVLRATMLKRRFAGTIIKTKQKSLPLDVMPCLFLIELVAYII